MRNKDVLFGNGYSITIVHEDESDECDWCNVRNHFLAFERLAPNGGWSHLFCLPKSQFEELQQLMERAEKILQETK